MFGQATNKVSSSISPRFRALFKTTGSISTTPPLFIRLSSSTSTSTSSSVLLRSTVHGSRSSSSSTSFLSTSRFIMAALASGLVLSMDLITQSACEDSQGSRWGFGNNNNSSSSGNKGNNSNGNNSEKDDKLLVGDEFRKAIQSKVDHARRELASKVKKLPSIKIHVPGPDDKSITYGITVELERGHDIVGLLAEWSRVTRSGTADGSTMKPVITERNKEVNIISMDKTSSIQAVSEQLNSKSPQRFISARAYKDGGFSQEDIYYLVEGFKNAALGSVGNEESSGVSDGIRTTLRKGSLDNLFGSFSDITSSDGRRSRAGGREENLPHVSNDPIERLQQLGVEVYDKEDNAKLGWDSLAGYDNVKKFVDETIINSIKFPEIYDAITKSTRVNFESNRPKAVLLEGPPGTGKTLTARILAAQVDRPLIHLKLENFMSKFYGESNQKLVKILDLCDEMDGTIIFLDEIDSFASSRDTGDMHEETRRLLSVLLQRLEGFQGKGKSLLVCATNRKQDLDPALISRFDLSVKYALPDKTARAAVFERYAKQFKGNTSALKVISEESDGLSCRDIKEACEQAERQLATRKINKEMDTTDTPTVDDYVKCIELRQQIKSIDVNNHIAHPKNPTDVF